MAIPIGVLTIVATAVMGVACLGPDVVWLKVIGVFLIAAAATSWGGGPASAC